MSSMLRSPSVPSVNSSSSGFCLDLAGAPLDVLPPPAAPRRLRGFWGSLLEYSRFTTTELTVMEEEEEGEEEEGEEDSSLLKVSAPSSGTVEMRLRELLPGKESKEVAEVAEVREVIDMMGL